jgi:lysosomal alpha-mannosidase
MVHRRLQQDDQRGVSQPLNETGLNGLGLIVRGVHRIGLSPVKGAVAAVRTAMQDVALFRPLLTYGGVPAAIAVANTSALNAPLPANVHWLSMQSLYESVWMVRLAHLYGTGEDPILSQNATVDLATIFNGRTFSGCAEYTLPGGQPLASVEPVQFKVAGQGVITAPLLQKEEKEDQQADGNGLQAMPITLGPLQVRTFQCTVQ